MAAEISDVLVEIPDENLPQLADMYKKEVSWAPHVFNLICMGIKWKQSEKFTKHITFLSPCGSWSRDGAIVVLIQLYCYDIFVFSLEHNYSNLYQGLIFTNKINYKKENAVFFCVHEKHIKTVMDVVSAKGLNSRQSKVPYLMYAMSSEEACSLASVTFPSDIIYAKKLDAMLARHINEAWPHRFLDSEKYLSALIEINGGWGLFLKDNDEIVAWGMKHCLGHLGMLQTDEKYKRKGYGSLITRMLAQTIGEEGNWPFATVLSDNIPSVRMFERLGFKKIGTCAYINLC